MRGLPDLAPGAIVDTRAPMATVRTPSYASPAGRHAPAALTPAQQRLLMEVFKFYPASHKPRTGALARRLVAAGMLQEEPAAEAFRLTPKGLEHASRISAHRIIETANAHRAERHGRPADAPTTPMPADASGPSTYLPRDWPFPVSAHRW